MSFNAPLTFKQGYTMGDRQAICQQARLTLAKIPPAAAGVMTGQYEQQVLERLGQDDISIQDISVLLVYYDCTAETLAGKIVRDKMGRG